MRRAIVVGALAAAVSAVGGPGSAEAAPCLRAPVEAPVVDPFREPPCPFCAGNRGLEYDVEPDRPVLAAAAGTVSFAGVVAGTRYVVVDHGDGRRTTVGRLGTVAVAAGEVVAPGALVGTTGADGLFFGVRVGDRYVDPAPLLGRFVRRARLVPVDGTAPRPGRPPELVCPGA